jgi:hypothetical protein
MADIGSFSSMFYQSIVLLIFRPYVHAPIKVFDKSPLQISFSAAVEISTIISFFKNSGYLEYPLVFLPHILLSAALVFIEKITSGDESTLHRSKDDQLTSPSQLAFSFEQCILNLRQMSHTWDVSHQSLHVIWNRAAGLKLPQRVKKLLYLDTPISPVEKPGLKKKIGIPPGLDIPSPKIADRVDSTSKLMKNPSSGIEVKNCEGLDEIVHTTGIDPGDGFYNPEPADIFEGGDFTMASVGDLDQFDMNSWEHSYGYGWG